MSLSFISTRGRAPTVDLRGATMAGLAADGGLYVPQTWPAFDETTLAAMRGKSYAEIAFMVLSPFTAGVIPNDVLRRLIGQAYAAFDDAAVTPLRQLNDRLWVLELFHGPTLAFKDIALQLLGGVFDYFLGLSKERVTVIGATSGDTGSAAMAALKDRANIDVVILYPAHGPSELQRRQMTCMAGDNLHAVAIDGSFDDCQNLVKSLFNDLSLRARYNFAAINSINAFRILAQMVYYFYAAAQFAPKPVSFAVPTGNFGNVYAGYAAAQCGLPVSKLAVASNQNDILTRFFTIGRMQTGAVQATLSPSMDIQLSSNAERLIFDLVGRDGSEVAHKMQDLAATGTCAISPMQLGMARQIFTAAKADDDQTLATIAEIDKNYGYKLDPHSAVGVSAALQLAAELPVPVIALACAHPAKFPATMRRALGIEPTHESLAALADKPERTTLLPPTRQAIELFLSERITR